MCVIERIMSLIRACSRNGKLLNDLPFLFASTTTIMTRLSKMSEILLSSVCAHITYLAGYYYRKKIRKMQWATSHAWLMKHKHPIIQCHINTDRHLSILIYFTLHLRQSHLRKNR